MKTISTVAKRERFLIAVYAENSSRCFDLKKSKLKERANRLLSELRARYNYNIEMKQVDINSDWASITQNGKYSLD